MTSSLAASKDPCAKPALGYIFQYISVFVLYPCKLPTFSFLFFMSYFQKGTKLGISSLLPGWGKWVVNIVLTNLDVDISWYKCLGEGLQPILGVGPNETQSCHLTIYQFFSCHPLLLWRSLPNLLRGIFSKIYVLFFFSF